jgi:ubiquinone/menaquinone biosynthesis C-methylase UbiE
VGAYADQVVPRLLDVAGGAARLRHWREKACGGLGGEVLEIGFGSGHNVPFYPPEVTRVFAVEPSMLAWRLAGERVSRSSAAVMRLGRAGESVPLPDASCDAALITFTLCTVTDPGQVLAEVARVLRPRGALHLLEHGLAPDARVARWQHRLEPLQRRLFDGCHLTRDTRALVAGAGLEIVWSESAYAGPLPWSYLTVAVARASSP